MIRLLVMYNLAPGSDESAYLDWRLSDHQASNAAMPETLRTDFAKVVGAAWPADASPRFKYVTSAEWPNQAAFEAAFYEPTALKDLQENLKRLGEYEFLITEILASSE